MDEAKEGDEQRDTPGHGLHVGDGLGKANLRNNKRASVWGRFRECARWIAREVRTVRVAMGTARKWARNPPKPAPPSVEKDKRIVPPEERNRMA